MDMAYYSQEPYSWYFIFLLPQVNGHESVDFGHTHLIDELF